MIKSYANRILTAFTVALILAAAQLPAQTLARPGWVGSGLTAQTWFKHAIFYEIDAHSFSDSNADGIGDLKGITQRLDYLHLLSVDAILLKPLTASRSSGQPTTIDPVLGTLDDFDELTLQASRLKIRILLELPSPDPAIASFWLTRGVAGFYIPGKLPANDAATQAIRRLLPTYVGQRILMTDADFATAFTVSKTSSNDLLLDRTIVKSLTNPASELRAELDQSQTLLYTGTLVFAVDTATTNPLLARILATATLLNRSAALIVAGEELGVARPALLPWGQSIAVTTEEAPETARPAAPVVATPDKYTPYVPYVRPVAPKKAAPTDPTTAMGQETNPNSLLNFYRELGRLHHGSTALRDGEEITLNHDDRDALIWIRKPASPSQFNPPILIACNLSDKPVVLSLKTDVAHLQLHGSFLRTVLRSDDLMGGTSLDPITLPPFSVDIGDLR